MRLKFAIDFPCSVVVVRANILLIAVVMSRYQLVVKLMLMRGSFYLSSVVFHAYRWHR